MKAPKSATKLAPTSTSCYLPHVEGLSELIAPHDRSNQKIAVIGGGISGMLAARLLATRHHVEVYEAGEHVGGHAHTVSVTGTRAGRSCEVNADVAFMVLNRRTYPNFCRMLSSLGVETQESDMSLSVRCFSSGLEYQGSSLNGLFAQRRNLVRPSFYRMLRDIVRFNAAARQFCVVPDETISLGQFLDQGRFGREFREHYLIPMSAAIWSSEPSCLAGFPAKFILGFLQNHGLLQITDRPQWLTIAKRSQNYVAKLTAPLSDRFYTRTEVVDVRSEGDQLSVQFKQAATSDLSTKSYDHVVFATHADQTLDLLSDASDGERDVLGCFPYQANEAVLHTDVSVLPRRSRAWASWNYHLPAVPTDRVSVTYDLNRLQTLGLDGPLCLTLNPNCQIDPAKVLRKFDFQHPVFTADSVRSQKRFDEINDRRGISYCGAYWGYGFHEDGVNSALAVAKRFGLDLSDLATSMDHSAVRQASDTAFDSVADRSGPNVTSQSAGTV